jgi:amino acid transporter
MAQTDEESLISESSNSTEHSPLLGPDTVSDNASTLSNNEPLLAKGNGHAIDDDVTPETSALGRRIGWSSAYILVVSRVIGSGIFAMPGLVVQNVGSIGLALSMWVAGALVAWSGLVISMEYGAMLPRSGGVKVYLEYTYRWPRFFASIMVAVQAVLLGFTATNCIIFAKYILYASSVEPTDLATKTLAVGLLTAITVVHGGFYRTGIWIQNALGWLKIGLTIFMIATGIVVLFKGYRTEPVLEDFWTDSNWEWNTLSTTLFKILYSFAGLENVNNVMNEVKNPIRTIKTVGPAALLSTLVLYLLINIAYVSVVPLNEIKQSRELIAALFFEKLGLGRAFLPVAIALSAAGNVMVVTFSLVSLITAAWYLADGPGTIEPGSRAARVSSIPTISLSQHVRLTARWSDRSLYSLCPRHCAASIGFGL